MSGLGDEGAREIVYVSSRDLRVQYYIELEQVRVKIQDQDEESGGYYYDDQWQSYYGDFSDTSDSIYSIMYKIEIHPIARDAIKRVDKASYRISHELPGSVVGVERRRQVEGDISIETDAAAKYMVTVRKSRRVSRKIVEYDVQVGVRVTWRREIRYWVLVSARSNSPMLRQLALKAATILAEEVQGGVDSGWADTRG